MNIQKKLTWGAVLMGLVPVAIAVALTGWSANQGATDALRQQAEQRLIAMRDVSKAQIEHYFGTIRGQVRTLSNDKMIVDAAKGLTKAFHAYPADKGLGEAEIAALRADLGGYYKNDFGGEYQTRNGGAAPNMGAVLTQIGTEAVALQNTFINANPNPLGSKHRLDDPKDGSLYARIHNMYHPHIRQFLEEFGYYDIFLVEPETGDVVYSVFKELDFATSLINGPYAQTGLGQAFREANAATGQDAVAITDFAPYKPSYEDQAGFIASPIYDNGAKVGILIFQMPIDRINAVMTHNKKWADVGLGASGETYLVGADHKARSISRFLAEDPDGYAAALKAGGTSQTVIDAIRTKGSNIGLQDLVTEGTQAAVSGQTGFGIFPDYRGVPVLSAYAPLAIPGLNWAIMSEIDVEEAFAAANELTRAIIQWGVGVSLAILLLAAALGRWFALGITRPLLRSVDVMRDIAEGEGDLTRRLDDAGNDELADFAGAFNRFADRLSGIVRQAQVSAQGVAAGAGEIKDGNVDLSQRTEEQAASLEETASSMEQMTANVRQSADNAAKANQMAVGARSQAEHGGRVVADAVAAMAEVEAASRKISEIIGMVGEIAFQTNLLALNASVEAARAGEQGRGFAVVASEVRNLAQRSATAAGDIRTLIDDTVTKVHAGAKLVETSGTALNEIIASINKVSDMVGEINAASQEQAHGIEQVNTAILQMDEVTQQNAALVEETTATSDTLASEAEKLAGLMGQFRVDDGHAGPPRPPAPKMTTQTPAAPKAGPARKAGGFLSKRGAAKPAPQPVARDASADEGMDF